MSDEAGKIKNILFIMTDQLRADYLSCYGHPHLHTPHIDALAARGVTFSRAYTQSPVCGPARASFYTGRYAHSHGATWNFVPVRAGEPTMGDHLRVKDIRSAVVGKTHMIPDMAGMNRMGLDKGTNLGLLIHQTGFEPYARDDGGHPTANVNPDLPYNNWLRSLGYESENPWHDFANSAAGKNDEVLSGWAMRNAVFPARIHADHSETAYTTNRALEFMDEQGDKPWCLHLSYIKPHWPYMAPEPYHAMYGQEDRLPVVKADAEKDSPHPVYNAFSEHMRAGQTFSRDDVCDAVVPTYMALVKEVDDHIGRVTEYLQKTGRIHDTLVVFTSDHGDYLGDHWLGEKDLFHEPSARIPMIVCDPTPAGDTTRGMMSDALVEAIDLAPTFVEAVGGEIPTHILEGRSLMPILRGESDVVWRDAAFSEIDYGFYRARWHLGLGVNDARAIMTRTDRWKYVHYKGFEPQLFDMDNDPEELTDLGRETGYEKIRGEMRDRVLEWLLERKNRITLSDRQVEAMTDSSGSNGVMIGYW